MRSNGRSGTSSNRSTMTAVAYGISCWVWRNSCSRTISWASTRSLWSVRSSAANKAGPDGNTRRSVPNNSSVFSPVRALMGTTSRSGRSLLRRSRSGIKAVLAARSILLRPMQMREDVPRRRSAICVSAPVSPCPTSTTKRVTSASCGARRAVSTICRLSRELCRRWMPGVSMKMNWAAGSVRTPSTRVRVVCGFGVTNATRAPTSRFNSVDFPTLGRPTSATKPQRCPLESGAAMTAVRDSPRAAGRTRL